jgi:integrase
LPQARKRTVAALKAIELTPGKGDEVIWDPEVTGFGLRLRRSTVDKDVIVRTWIYDFRFHGKSRRYLIAGLDEITPVQALSVAMDKRAQVRLGADPQAEREQKRAENRKREQPHRFDVVAGGYLKTRETKVRASSLAEFRRYLTGKYFAKLHPLDVGAVTKRDVALCLNGIPQYPTAKGARMTLNRFYVWCMSQGICESNPCIGTVVEKPEGYKPGSRTLSVNELAQIWRGLEDDEYGRIVRLMILLASRREEIGAMRWSEFSPDRRVWTLPDPRAKNDTALTLDLPKLAHDIVMSVPEMVGRDQLFGNRGTGFHGWGRCKKRLDARIGIPKWRLHDVRGSVSTAMNDLGIAQPHIVEQILNHKWKTGVHGTYNKSVYQNEVRVALIRWADHIISTVRGEERKVLQFQAASGE